MISVSCFHLAHNPCHLSIPGKYHEAEHLLRREAATCEEEYGRDHPVTLKASHCLGQVYIETDELDEAETLLESTVAKRCVVLGPSHIETVESVCMLMRCLILQVFI